MASSLSKQPTVSGSIIPQLGAVESSNPPMDDDYSTETLERSDSDLTQYDPYNNPTPEPERLLEFAVNKPTINYKRELFIRGIIEHSRGDKAQPRDWKELQDYLNSNVKLQDLEAAYIRGANRLRSTAYTQKGLDILLLSILSSLCAPLFSNEETIKTCLWKQWRTIPLPWRGGTASDVPMPWPDLTIGHPGGRDLMPHRLHRVISPFFTPVEEAFDLYLPCAVVQIRGDDDTLKRANQHAGAIMLRNMVELSLTAKPLRLLKEMQALENRVSVLTVGVSASSLVITGHWIKRNPDLGTVEYHSRDLRSWDLKGSVQNQEGLYCISRAVEWVLRKNRSWVIGRLKLIMA